MGEMIDVLDENGIKTNGLVETNSFYDARQILYSEEELQLYRDLAGMPLFDSYQELMQSLENEKAKDTFDGPCLQKKTHEGRSCNKR